MNRMPDDVIKERNDLLIELEGALLPSLDESTEVCCKMLEARNPQTNKTAVFKMLNDKVDAGELKWRWALWNGNRVKAYSRK